MDLKIPFNRPHLTHKEIEYISHAHSLGALSGDGTYTKKCHAWLEKRFNVGKALLTHSCTGALEMMAMLANIEPGDEVIMPSYTFVSTANAFVLRGAVPVFIDVRPDTLNIDETLLESAYTAKTKAVIVVHYGGVGCEMDAINEWANARGVFVFEDAAQGFLATYKGRLLGTLSSLSAFSFHETKNVISGEGGSLFVNDPEMAHRAEIIREKGTNRSQFFRGQIDKYTWVDIGSSYLPGEIVAAFLLAQLEAAEEISQRKKAVWQIYHAALSDLEATEFLERPKVPSHCEHNGHLYYVLLRSLDQRSALIDRLKSLGIMSVFHYVPLHNSPAGMKYGRAVGTLPVTCGASERLLRLPSFVDLETSDQERVIAAIHDFAAENS